MTAVVRVTTDLQDIDLDVVHRWLSEEAYWALGRSREVVEAAARASMNFGALDADDRLVGYARVVTARVPFAWLGDVFVEPEAGGPGAGRARAGAVAAAVRPRGLKRVMLATADAHELYRRFDFEGVVDPEKLMILGAG